VTEKKIIAVVGATGAQGGGLVRAILADKGGPFRPRALTRDVNSPKAQALAAAGAEQGFEVVVATPVMEGGEVVSSTRIRNLLLAGDVTAAARLLGRPYGVKGKVVHGEKRGRELGFPTINLSVPLQRLLPRDGIYAMTVRVRDEEVVAAASLGVRPTFGGGDRTLEAYLLDWEGDVYGDTIEAAFVKRLRDELRFASAEELTEQIARDVEATRAALRDRPHS